VQGMDEIVHEFLVESYENLDQLDRDLVALEQDPTAKPVLASVFRTVHTIKGTSGFLAFGKLERLTHVGEGLLSKLRDGELELSPEITGLLLELVDAVRRLLQSIERTGGEEAVEEPATLDRLVARLTRVQQAAADARGPDGRLLGEKLVQEGLVHPDDVTLAVLEQHVGDSRRIGEILVEHGAVDPSALHEVLEDQPESRRSVVDSSVRVDVDVLDGLMRLVGELLLTRNQVAGAVTASGDLAMTQAWQRLGAITADLQEGVMKARMQPIESAWNKLPRMVRDLSQAMGKQVRLDLVGGDTELDRSVLEAVKDPLTHLVRNALDHGIEPPATRLAAGKPAVGRLTLSASHDGGQVHLEITDDGAGIDPARIAATAVDKGMLTAAHAKRMSAQDLVNCVFLPGFSTAERVTNVSGRGVGMDVVKTNMERIGGSVEVRSSAGFGTTFHITIPLTLAIVAALIVASDGLRFAVPQANVLELVRIPPGQLQGAVERIGGAPVHRLRGQLLPLVPLRELLGQGPRVGEGDGTYIVVIGTQDRHYGLLVDDVLDTEDIVVKPLSEQLKLVPVYAGTTILGDGRVGLILDAWSLAAHANVGAVATRLRSRSAPAAAEEEEEERRTSLLVVRIADDRMLAVPLDQVARLEEAPVAAVERVGDREALQYRDGILPIVRLSELVASRPGRGEDVLQVVVYTEGGRSVGLVVEEILDIVEEALDVVTDIDGPGVTGTAVVRRQVMEMLDVRAAILAADPHFYDHEAASSGVATAGS
jgi:two-component system, chemotaxis family, sensor kinase CheA